MSLEEAKEKAYRIKGDTEYDQAQASDKSTLTSKQQTVVKNALADRVWTKARGSEEEQSEIARDNWMYAKVSNEQMVRMMNAYDPKHEYRIEKYSEKKGAYTYGHQILCREPVEDKKKKR